MSIRSSKTAFVLLLIPGLLLSGCRGTATAGAATPAPASTPSGKLASDGFNCPEPNPRLPVTSTELNIYVWTEYIPADFYECFKLVYGVDVKADEYSSMEEMRATLAETTTAYDLAQPTDFAITPMIRDGLLSTLDHDQLPILANLNPHYLNLPFDPQNKYSIPYESGTDAIAVDTSAVTTIPRSWSDLWDSEYAARIVFADDERAVIGLTLLSLGFDVNTTDAGELEQARRALLQLKPNIEAFDSDSPSSRLLSGEASIAETWTGEAFMAAQQQHAIQYVYPTEGAMLWQDNWVMLQNAPHQDAAYAWLNYTMQGDVFWMMLTNFPYTNPDDAALAYARGNPMQVTDVSGENTTLGAVYDTYLNSTITNPPAEVIRSGHRIADVGNAVTLYDQIWAELRGEN
jgi:spermidine/putrescine-binding protein